MKVSVAMTSYNGAHYIIEQIDSILCQLNQEDELLISDDGSTDGTIEIIEEYSKNDGRVKLYKNKGLGVIRNFEYVIKKCSNDIIFLSDQDDIWKKNKVESVKNSFLQTGKKVILHNGVDFKKKTLLNKEMKLVKKKHRGVIANIIRSNYWGCCIAFDREILFDIVPFPKNVVAHDQWIGLIAEFKQEVFFLNEDLIFHRLHETNVTKKLTLKGKIVFRMKMTASLFEYFLLKFSRRKS